MSLAFCSSVWPPVCGVGYRRGSPGGRIGASAVASIRRAENSLRPSIDGPEAQRPDAASGLSDASRKV